MLTHGYGIHPAPWSVYREKYPGMTRGQLSRVDLSLYQALRARGLLDKIPLKRRQTNEELLDIYHSQYLGLYAEDC